MGKFININNSENFIKEANRKKIESNLKKGMSPEKAVKKAYPKMSTNEVKRVVRLIKKQTIN